MPNKFAVSSMEALAKDKANLLDIFFVSEFLVNY
jgi:hypothetical protein